MLKMRKIFKVVLLVSVMAICLGAATAMAQSGFGIRAGATADPNQFHFGGHYTSDPLIGNLNFRPNLEIGVGSKVTTVAANFEFAYSIPVPKTEVSAYVGAGPSLLFYKFSDFPNRDTDLGGGFNVLIGAEHKNGLFGELKVGAIDSPEFKFTVGFTFR